MLSLSLFLHIAFVFYGWDRKFATDQYFLYRDGVMDSRIHDNTLVIMSNPEAYDIPEDPEAKEREQLLLDIFERKLPAAL